MCIRTRSGACRARFGRTPRRRAASSSTQSPRRPSSPARASTPAPPCRWRGRGEDTSRTRPPVGSCPPSVVSYDERTGLLRKTSRLGNPLVMLGEPVISPHLPTSPHISPHLPTSRDARRVGATERAARRSPHISPHLPTSPQVRPSVRRGGLLEIHVRRLPSVGGIQLGVSGASAAQQQQGGGGSPALSRPVPDTSRTVPGQFQDSSRTRPGHVPPPQAAARAPGRCGSGSTARGGCMCSTARCSRDVAEI